MFQEICTCSKLGHCSECLDLEKAAKIRLIQILVYKSISDEERLKSMLPWPVNL